MVVVVGDMIAVAAVAVAEGETARVGRWVDTEHKEEVAVVVAVVVVAVVAAVDTVGVVDEVVVAGGAMETVIGNLPRFGRLLKFSTTANGWASLRRVRLFAEDHR